MSFSQHTGLLSIAKESLQRITFQKPNVSVCNGTLKAKEIVSQRETEPTHSLVLLFFGEKIGCKDKEAVGKVNVPMRICGSSATDGKWLVSLASISFLLVSLIVSDF